MTQANSPQQRAHEFLQTAHLFQLGHLPTESSHPGTRDLSRLAKEDPAGGVDLLRSVDILALEKFSGYLEDLEPLYHAVRETLSSGKRVFLCGCGATGRLSLTLEFLWRSLNPGKDQRDSVVGFMAGGDVALVHSLEGFEDYPNYGAEQLVQLGFTDGDLLISSSEGGETPFVLGATEKAAQLSKRKPFFLYCNPREVLVEHVERSRRVLESDSVHSICLFVGPMALSGSTRMQASTVLMLGIGLTLFHWREGKDRVRAQLGRFIDFYQRMDLRWLAGFVEGEAAAYQAGDKVLYAVEDFAITVFTDTTERAPTFSLPPFNNQVSPRADHSLVYIMIPSTSSVKESWAHLLKREPRVLNWPERNSKTSMEYLSGFDFSRNAEAYRRQALPQSTHHRFTIGQNHEGMFWEFRELRRTIALSAEGLLFDHLLLKMLLNSHSTLMMGRLDRYVSNLMTWVFPTNGKLIDRASRYTQLLLVNEGVTRFSYADVVNELFVQFAGIAENESVVLKTYQALKAKSQRPVTG